MPPLRVEVTVPGEDNWKPLGQLDAGDRFSSLSDNTPDGRSVFIFGINPVDNCAYVKQSEFGVDVTGPNGRTVIAVGGFTTIATIRNAERYELTVTPDESPGPITFRFSYEG
ncbi:MAG TPA: hypothetical protein VLF43_05395 [Candidatus Saccharimonadales bacterium]|nr:hypothetical protein [Candidatus Saccharimonadales bacterium]